MVYYIYKGIVYDCRFKEAVMQQKMLYYMYEIGTEIEVTPLWLALNGIDESCFNEG